MIHTIVRVKQDGIRYATKNVSGEDVANKLQIAIRTDDTASVFLDGVCIDVGIRSVKECEAIELELAGVSL